jgi:hypothetical protein
VDAGLAALGPGGVQEQKRRSLKVAANSPLVGAELADYWGIVVFRLIGQAGFLLEAADRPQN